MTMRVLLAAEGPTDEVVAKSIIRRFLPSAEIVPKRFTSRGLVVVRRSIPALVRAAHYQLYDLLVIHFDTDDTLRGAWRHVSESSRWQEAQAKIESVLPLPDHPSRERRLLTLLSFCCGRHVFLFWSIVLA